MAACTASSMLRFSRLNLLILVGKDAVVTQRLAQALLLIAFIVSQIINNELGKICFIYEL